MLDWNLAKKGATIVLRCGGRIELETGVIQRLADLYAVYIDAEPRWFYSDGSRHINRHSPFDIVSIEPAPEPKRTEVFIPFYTKYGLGEINSIKGVAETRINQHGGGCLIRITCTDDPNNPDPTIEVVK